MNTQLDIFQARQSRDKGMTKAINHADEVSPGWGEVAYDYFKTFVSRQHEPFKIEDFREWVKDFIPAPPSLRSYGVVTMKAARKGLITHVGYAKVKNARAHMANCAVWKRS